jgi:thioesterase domain-containing protein
MAYEMARQLISRGKSVSFLGIVDIEPTAGKLMRKHRYPDFRERIVRLKERIGKNGIGSTSTFALRWLKDWYLEQKSNQSNGQIIANLVRNSWRRSKYFLTKSSPAFTPKATENSAEQRSHSNTTGANVFQHKMVNAFYEHSPRKYSGDITHFVTPSNAKFVESRPVSAWSNLTSGSVEIIQIQGDHISVGKNPDIKQIADRINMLDA